MILPWPQPAALPALEEPVTPRPHPEQLRIGPSASPPRLPLQPPGHVTPSRQPMGGGRRAFISGSAGGRWRREAGCSGQRASPSVVLSQRPSAPSRRCPRPVPPGPAAAGGASQELARCGARRGRSPGLGGAAAGRVSVLPPSPPR